MECRHSRGQIFVEVLIVLLIVGLASLGALSQFTKNQQIQKRMYLTKEQK